jgi:hypothetical protein
LMGLRIQIPQAAWKYVSCECSVLSCRWADPSSRGALPSMSVSLSVIKYNNNPPNVQWVDRRGQTKKERQRYTPISDTDNYTHILRKRVIVLLFLVAVVSVEHRLFYITISIRRKKSLRCQLTKKKLTVISIFCRVVDKKWAILGHYAASSVNLLATFRYSLSVPSAAGK